jgi:hypothetical protein
MTKRWLILIGLLCASADAFAEVGKDPAPAGQSSSGTNQHFNTYREGFQPPADVETETQKMRKLVARINNMSLPRQLPEKRTLQPRKTEPEVKPKPEVAIPKPELKKASILDSGTLEELRNRLPRSVADPIKLADALFQSGHRAEALVFYRGALPKATRTEDRCWLMYQMGICLSKTQPEEAKNWFRQLMTEYPNSHWNRLAEIQFELVDWLMRNQPRQFLDDIHACQQVVFHGLEFANAADALVEDVDLALEVGIALVLVVDHAVDMKVCEQYDQSGNNNGTDGGDAKFLLFLLA